MYFGLYGKTAIIALLVAFGIGFAIGRLSAH
jgi:hypothetical protein